MCYFSNIRTICKYFITSLSSETPCSWYLCFLDVFEAGRGPQNTFSWWESSMKVGIKIRSTSEDVKGGAVFQCYQLTSILLKESCFVELAYLPYQFWFIEPLLLKDFKVTIVLLSTRFFYWKNILEQISNPKTIVSP